jgi:hypothetical protein
MLTPEFPYKKNQIILSSDRIILHSKLDAVFVFGKQMVALASNGTVNIDAKEKILLDSDKVELGHDAELRGEPVVLGNKLASMLLEITSTLNWVGNQLSAVSKTGDAQSWIILQECGLDLKMLGEKIVGQLLDTQGPNHILSKNTFSR